jgi:subtilase family serine protease
MSIKLSRVIKSKTFARVIAVTLFSFAILCLYGAVANPARGVANNQRVFVGAEDQAAPLTVTVWLKQHNEAALDALLQQMYDKSSPNYHHWLTMDQYRAQFAPSAQDVAAVSKHLAQYNLRVSSVDKFNHFVRAQGRVGDAQRAFNTHINRMMVNGTVRRVTPTEPYVAGPTGALIASIQGMSDHRFTTNVSRTKDPETGLPYAGVPAASAGPNGVFFSSDCLRPPQTVTFTTNGGLPKATYTGNRFGANITNQNPPNLPPCGYGAREMHQAYGLSPHRGFDGTGQTVVIVDAFGSNTIQDDSNVFSQLNGLPPLTNANFQIFEPTGPAECTATNGCIGGNWQFETSIDVQWAHAMAPKANIALVVAVDNFTDTLDMANLFAIENQLGTVISNSFGIPEIVLVQEAPSILTVENQIAKTAALLGISLNVSTGDSGDDFLLDIINFGIFATSVDALADSPFVTAIGGTSTFLDRQHNIKLQTGWGNNLTIVANPAPNPPSIPPFIEGFNGGAGGGNSVVFSKPAYQRRLPGSFRKVPDIAMNADPFTGCEIIVTPDSVPGHPKEVDVFGGTSLSTPMFSGVWAIANQVALAQGLATPLGQAAPLLYNLPQGAVIDVNVPASATTNNVTGTIFNPPNPVQNLSADALATPQPPNTRYLSALYNSPFSTRWFDITFGTDSSLATTPGWDNVTGVGTPNGAQFIQAVVTAAKQ